MNIFKCLILDIFQWEIYANFVLLVLWFEVGIMGNVWYSMVVHHFMELQYSSSPVNKFWSNLVKSHPHSRDEADELSVQMLMLIYLEILNVLEIRNSVLRCRGHSSLLKHLVVRKWKGVEMTCLWVTYRLKFLFGTGFAFIKWCFLNVMQKKRREDVTGTLLLCSLKKNRQMLSSMPGEDRSGGTSLTK